MPPPEYVHWAEDGDDANRAFGPQHSAFAAC